MGVDLPDFCGGGRRAVGGVDFLGLAISADKGLAGVKESPEY
jgi:hypothetical protein